MHRCVHVCGSHTQVSTDHALLSETLPLYNQEFINLSSLPIQRASGTIVFHLQNTGRFGVCHCFLVSCWESTLRSSRQTLCQKSHPPVLGTSSGVIPQSQLLPRTGGRDLPGKTERNLVVQETWVRRDKEAFPGRRLQQPSRVETISRIYAQTAA